MSPERNKTVARRALDEIFSRGNYGVLGEIYADNFVGHAAANEIRGTKGLEKFFTALRSAFPDINFTIEDQIAEGDRVVTRWMTRGTHKGEFNGVSATGKPIKAAGITISRVADGKIVEGWTNWDVLGLMKQIGAVP
jgi:steroid delta-isomerase-like uncharacterized protein